MVVLRPRAPRRSTVVGGGSLLAGVVAGWLVGLLRPTPPRRRQGPS